MEKSVSLFNLRNLENVLQRNLRTGTARECIFRASGGTRFKNFDNHGGGKGEGELQDVTGLPKKTLDMSLTYSKHCQTFKMEHFVKIIMPECWYATRNFSEQEEGLVELGHFDKCFVKNTIRPFLSKIRKLFSLWLHACECS